MNRFNATGETMLLAYKGQLQIAAALAAKGHHLMQRFLARLGQLPLDTRPK